MMLKNNLEIVHSFSVTLWLKLSLSVIPFVDSLPSKSCQKVPFVPRQVEFVSVPLSCRPCFPTLMCIKYGWNETKEKFMFDIHMEFRLAYQEAQGNHRLLVRYTKG